MTLPDKFWLKVKTSDTNFYDGTLCWKWTASKNNLGYGQFGLNGKIQLVHRISYEDKFGKIQSGLVINHLCRNRCCVNPDHLEVVTQKVNAQKGLAGFITGLRQRAKTHCPQDHEYSQENTYVFPDGRRACRICMRIKSNQWKQRKKLEIINN